MAIDKVIGIPKGSISKVVGVNKPAISAVFGVPVGAGWSAPALLGGWHDEFTDNFTDPNRWTVNGVTVAETGQKLQVSGTTDAWLRSYEPTNGGYFLDGKTLRWQFTGVPAASSNYSQQFLLAPSDAFASYIFAQIFNGNLSLHDSVTGTLFTVAWDATAHAWLRFRFIAGTSYFEASTDGTSFTTLHSWSTISMISGSNVNIYLRHEVFAGGSVTHTWDNIDTDIYVPESVTDPATAITSTTASISGTVNPKGSGAIGRFRISTSDPGWPGPSAGSFTAGILFAGSGTSPVSFSEGLTGLTPATTYYYWTFGINNIAYGFGDVMSFTTLP